MPKSNKGIIRNLSTEEFKNLVIKSDSISKILRELNLSITGSSHKIVKKRIIQEKLDCSHMLAARKLQASLLSREIKIPLDQILVKNSTYNRTNLKKQLLDAKYLENKCSECGILPEWNSKILILQLDHLNGINNDNRLENLRILCPNCHSQTNTFSNRNKRRKYNCESCGKIRKNKNSTRCVKCANAINNKNKIIDLPDLNALFTEVIESSYESVGRKYGVTGACIKKRLKLAGYILKPKKSYPVF